MPRADKIKHDYSRDVPYETATRRRSARERENELTVPDLKEWEPTSLPEHFFVVLEGKRRTGKTTFARWLLQYYANTFCLAWCMTKTKASQEWHEIFGKDFIFDTWNPTAVLKLIEKGDAAIKKYGSEEAATKAGCSMLLVLDDIISEKIHDDPVFKLMAVAGRHHLLAVILMTQDPHAISPLVRDNSDVAVIFKLKTFRNKESLWKDFMNDIDKPEAMAMLDRYCIEHEALVCNQVNLTPETSKNFYKTTGDKTKLEHPDYMLGSPEQKRLNQLERNAKKQEEKFRKNAVVGKPSPSDTREMTVDKILNG